MITCLGTEYSVDRLDNLFFITFNMYLALYAANMMLRRGMLVSLQA